MKEKRTKNILFYRLILPAIFLLPFFSVSAQRGANVIINGIAPSLSGEEISLITFDDYLSGQHTTIAKDKISKDGTFELSYKVDKIQLVQLAIRNCRAEFYLAPNRKYRFNVDMDPQLLQVFDPGNFGGYLQVKNLEPDTSDLNYKINYFTAYFQDALDYFYPLQSQSSYDSLFYLVKKNFPLQYNPDNFYHSYIYYSMGMADFMTNHKYPDTIYNRYFDNDYILYNNPAYMALFKDFYKDYLYHSTKLSKPLIDKAINISPDYTVLFNEAGKDPYLVNERLRELVLIYNLWGFYNHTEFDNQHIFFLLNYIQKNSHFPEHISIVKNIINRITLGKENKSLENIELRKPNGSSFKLSKLKGKWVFIQFFTTQCTDCIREMMMLKALHEQWKEKITFLSISVDGNEEEFTSFVNEYKMFDWLFLYFDQQYEWTNTLEVYSLPENILLNPEGKIALRNAPDIGKDLSRYLYIMFYEEQEEEQNPLFQYRPRSRNSD